MVLLHGTTNMSTISSNHIDDMVSLKTYDWNDVVNEEEGS